MNDVVTSAEYIILYSQVCSFLACSSFEKSCFWNRFWRKRTEQQRAAAAAAFGSGFSGGLGSYPPQGRGAGYSSFSDDHAAWADPASGANTPGRPGTPATNKTKQVGLASVPLSQRGEF